MTAMTAVKRAARQIRAKASKALAQTPVPSPCNSICQMDGDSGWCLGCLRTLDEIAQWSVLDDHEKRTIWSRLLERAGHPERCNVAAPD